MYIGIFEMFRTLAGILEETGSPLSQHVHSYPSSLLRLSHFPTSKDPGIAKEWI